MTREESRYFTIKVENLEQLKLLEPNIPKLYYSDLITSFKYYIDRGNIGMGVVFKKSNNSYHGQSEIEFFLGTTSYGIIIGADSPANPFINGNLLNDILED